MAKVVSELSTEGEGTDEVLKYINQKRDEIILAIKRELANIEITATQTKETRGKLCSFFYCVITRITCIWFLEDKSRHIRTKNME